MRSADKIERRKRRRLAAQDRCNSPDRGYSRRRSGAARAVRRPTRPRALRLHAIAARPLHAAEPAGQAALALGLRRAPRMAGKAAIAANAGLLTIGTGGVLAADTSAGSPWSARPTPGGAKATPPASSVAHPAAPPPPRARRAPYRAAARSGRPCRGGGSRPCARRLLYGRPRAAPAPLRASARAPCN